MNIKITATWLLLGALLGPASAYAADTSTDTPGQYLDDATLTTKVKAALTADKLINGGNGSSISVRTDHGVVDLTGTVNSKSDSDRATAVATGVKAVGAVHNNLTIVPF